MEKMVTHEFQRISYGGHLELVKFTDIPESVKFCKMKHWNDNQQSFIVVIEHDRHVAKQLNSLATSTYSLGDLIIVHLDDVKPLSEIPTISLDDLRSLHEEYMKSFLVKFIARDGTLLSMHRILEFLGEKFVVSTVQFKTWTPDHDDFKMLEIDTKELQLLLGVPAGTPLMSAGRWTIPSDSLEDFQMYQSRIDELIELCY